MSDNNAWTISRLDPLWRPWSVPRVAKRAIPAQGAARISLIEKWIARRNPTPFQRCLAIHIVNATYPETADAA